MKVRVKVRLFPTRLGSGGSWGSSTLVFIFGGLHRYEAVPSEPERSEHPDVAPLKMSQLTFP